MDPKISPVVQDARCVIKTKECNFFGMHYIPDGVKLSPDKNNDKEELEPSKDKKKLH